MDLGVGAELEAGFGAVRFGDAKDDIIGADIGEDGVGRVGEEVEVVVGESNEAAEHGAGKAPVGHAVILLGVTSNGSNGTSTGSNGRSNGGSNRM